MADHYRDQTKYFCTRPRLVSYLMEHGYTPERVPNPFDPTRAAWEFPYSRRLVEIANEWLEREGKRRR